MKRAARLFARLLMAGFLIALSGAEFLALYISMRRKPTARQRAAWLHRFCRRVLKQWRIDFETIGQFPAAGLIVSNHLSYLDIVLFSAASPCVFVSKAEVRHWPIIGLSALLSGAIFVDRESLRATRESNRQIERALLTGVPVVLFAEGFSTNGSSLLPFRSPLMEPAVRVSAPLTPACVSYRLAEGSVAEDVCYWGDATFFPHILKLLTRRGIGGSLRFGDALHGLANRKQAAALARERVVRLLQS